MAKTRMVTRTVKSTLIHALCLNIETAEPFNKDVVLTPRFKDAKKEIEKLREMIDNDTEKFVAIAARQDIEELYGMPEVDFLNYAVKLDKATNENDESEDE